MLGEAGFKCAEHCVSMFGAPGKQRKQEELRQLQVRRRQ
jgi:hypothetical protein